MTTPNLFLFSRLTNANKWEYYGIYLLGSETNLIYISGSPRGRQ